MTTTQQEAKTTTDHKKIKAWIEERNGKPAIVEGTENNEEGGGVLRISFDGQDDLKKVSWDKFFETFDGKDLQFLYQEKLKEGGKSRFFKFVDKD